MIGQKKQLDLALKKGLLGEVVHQARDQWGLIQVVDDVSIRSLHFDSVEKQSSMDLQDPRELVLTYTRAMMSGFLFSAKPEKCLCIGLGGASIPRFLLHCFPEIQIDVVELRREVIDIAYEYFFLPKDPRVQLFAEDGVAFVERTMAPVYDVIFVDAFEKHGMSKSIVKDCFFAGCRQILKPNGVFTINLWSEPKWVYRKTIRLLKEIFPEQLLELPVKDRTNRIVFGLNRGPTQLKVLALKKRAQILEKQFKLGLKKELETLIKQNRSFFKTESK